MVKISRNRTALNRLASCRAVLHVDTQKVRSKLLHKLEDLYDLAYNMARNPKLSLVDRNKWTRVAAYTVQMINCVCMTLLHTKFNKLLPNVRLHSFPQRKSKMSEKFISPRI